MRNIKEEKGRGRFGRSRSLYRTRKQERNIFIFFIRFRECEKQKGGEVKRKMFIYILKTGEEYIYILFIRFRECEKYKGREVPST